MDDANVYLGLGGADAIETAAKLARLYWNLTGEPERVHLIGRTNAYHGSHGISTSIGGIPANSSGVGPLNTRPCPFGHENPSWVLRCSASHQAGTANSIPHLPQTSVSRSCR